MAATRSPEEAALEKEMILSSSAYCDAVRRGRLTEAHEARKSRAKSALHAYRVEHDLLNSAGSRRSPEIRELIPAEELLARLPADRKKALTELNRLISKARRTMQRAQDGGRTLDVHIQRVDALLSERARLRSMAMPLHGSLLTGSPSVRATWAAEKKAFKEDIARKRAATEARIAAILATPTKTAGPTTRTYRNRYEEAL